jgi:hypothetical protein
MERAPDRVAGTAVFLTVDASSTPPAFLHNLKHNKILHERIIIMQVDTMDVPRVPEASGSRSSGWARASIRWSRATASWSSPTCRRPCAPAGPHGIAYDEMETSFFLGRETLVPSSRSSSAGGGATSSSRYPQRLGHQGRSSASRPTAPSSSATRSRCDDAPEAARPAAGPAQTRRLFDSRSPTGRRRPTCRARSCWHHDSIGAMADATLAPRPDRLRLGGFSMGGYCLLRDQCGARPEGSSGWR